MKNTEEKIVAGYCRVSTKTQVDRGSSLRVQREQIQHAAKQEELPNPFIFEDKGESGIKADRTQYSILKEEVRAGRVSTIIIYSVSRLGRDLLEMLTFIKECEKMKVRVISICDRYDSNKPQTKLHLHILGAIAENYIQENSGRISASIQNKKSRGKKYTKEIPFGYKLGKDNKLLECKEDRKVLMRIRNLKTRGHSYRSIADKLNGEGITTKKGKEWSKSLIGHYINNNVIGQVGVEAA